MKKSKKAAILAAVFSASLNLNGCTYGPEPTYMDEAVTTAPQTSVEAQQEVEDQTEESSTEAEAPTENDGEPQA